MTKEQCVSAAERVRHFARERVAEVLSALPQLASLDAAALSALVAAARLETFACHAEIFAPGTPGDSLMVVEHGAVTLVAVSDAPDGRRAAVHWLGSGEVFGELELLEAEPRMPTPTRQMRAVAATDSGVIVIDGRAIKGAFERVPAFAAELGRLAARRHRAALGALTRVAFVGLAEIRLAQVLLERARVCGTAAGAGLRMVSRITHQQLGDLIAADRRSVLEAMRLWEMAGMVSADRQGAIVIRQPKLLSAIASMRSGQRNTWDAEDWLALIDADLARGYNAQAYDLAREALKRQSLAREDRIRHRAVLALARSGATRQAIDLLKTFGFDHNHPDDDIAALEPRLVKDLALAAEPGAGAAVARRSAEGYRAIFARSANPYPGINAATMTMMAGDAQLARQLARATLARSSGADYWSCAIRSEAQLLLGEPREARRELAQAMNARDCSAGTVTVTRRQFRWLCRLLGVDSAEVLAPTGERVVGVGELVPSASWQVCAVSTPAQLAMAERVVEAGSELFLVHPGRYMDRALSDGKLAARWAAVASAARRVCEVDRSGGALPHNAIERIARGLAILLARELDAVVANAALPSGSPASAQLFLPLLFASQPVFDTQSQEVSGYWVREFASLADAVRSAIELCEKHSEAGFLCDLGHPGSGPWPSWVACAKPQLPAGSVLATELFVAEAAQSGDCSIGEYAGRLAVDDDGPPLSVYLLR